MSASAGAGGHMIVLQWCLTVSRHLAGPICSNDCSSEDHVTLLRLIDVTSILILIYVDIQIYMRPTSEMHACLTVQNCTPQILGSV